MSSVTTRIDEKRTSRGGIGNFGILCCSDQVFGVARAGPAAVGELPIVEEDDRGLSGAARVVPERVFEE
jgi:hypothetical protein